MSKTSLDITIVYVTEDNVYTGASESTIMSKLMANELMYYGETISGHSKPIIYLCDKDYQATTTSGEVQSNIGEDDE